ncbi:MAG: hypothetical protein ACHQ53_14655 [Polyangiales bacterium]
MRQSGWQALLTACVLWPLASHAHAQAITLPLEARHVSLGGELSYFQTTEDAASLHVLAPRLSAQYAFDAHFSIAADYGAIGFASSASIGGTETILRSGNPAILGMLRGTWQGVSYRVAVGATAPLARIDSAGQGRLQHAAFDYAEGLDGLWEVWLWAPARLSALCYGRLDFDLAPDVAFEVAAAPAVLFPLYEAYGRDPVNVFIPTLVGLSTQKGPVRLGLRLKAVIMPAGLDMLQLALEPWLRVMLGRAFVEARFTGNLDEPLAGERGPGVWGMHLSGGGVL